MGNSHEIKIRFEHLERLHQEYSRLFHALQLIVERPSGRLQLSLDELKALVDAAKHIGEVINGMVRDMGDEDRRKIGFRRS